MTFRIPFLEGPGHAPELRRLKARLSQANAIMSRAVKPRRSIGTRLLLSWIAGLLAAAAAMQMALRAIA